MTELIVTLEQNADPTFVGKIIENIKGVLKTKIKANPSSDKQSKDVEAEEWIYKMKTLSQQMDTSIIDTDDERAQYIMSK